MNQLEDERLFDRLFGNSIEETGIRYIVWQERRGPNRLEPGRKP